MEFEDGPLPVVSIVGVEPNPEKIRPIMKKTGTVGVNDNRQDIIATNPIPSSVPLGGNNSVSFQNVLSSAGQSKNAEDNHVSERGQTSLSTKSVKFKDKVKVSYTLTYYDRSRFRWRSPNFWLKNKFLLLLSVIIPVPLLAFEIAIVIAEANSTCSEPIWDMLLGSTIVTFLIFFYCLIHLIYRFYHNKKLVIVPSATTPSIATTVEQGSRDNPSTSATMLASNNLPQGEDNRISKASSDSDLPTMQPPLVNAQVSVNSAGNGDMALTAAGTQNGSNHTIETNLISKSSNSIPSLEISEGAEKKQESKVTFANAYKSPLATFTSNTNGSILSVVDKPPGFQTAVVNQRSGTTVVVPPGSDDPQTGSYTGKSPIRRKRRNSVSRFMERRPSTSGKSTSDSISDSTPTSFTEDPTTVHDQSMKIYAFFSKEKFGLTWFLRLFSVAFWVLCSCWFVVGTVFVFYYGNCLTAAPILYFSNMAVSIIFLLWLIVEILFCFILLRWCC